jgi:hypothetical protein
VYFTQPLPVEFSNAMITRKTHFALAAGTMCRPLSKTPLSAGDGRGGASCGNSKGVFKYRKTGDAPRLAAAELCARTDQCANSELPARREIEVAFVI